MKKHHGKTAWPRGVPLTPHRKSSKQSTSGAKYPPHHTSAHPPPPHLTGSGNKADGAYGTIKDDPAHVVGRGAGGKYVIEDGSRVHHRVNVHPNKKHYSVPGKTEQYPFRKHYDGLNHEEPHAFRAHHQPESGVPKEGHTAHGPMSKHMHNQKKPDVSGHDSYSPLRFSGHPGAHQVGKLSKGRTTFKDRQTHTWGKTPVAKGSKHGIGR